MEFENNYEIVENEEMTTDLVNFEEMEAETEEESGISTIVAMAIGAGATAAVFGLVGLAKKGLKKLKAKKETAVKPENVEASEGIEAEFEEIDTVDEDK